MFFRCLSRSLDLSQIVFFLYLLERERLGEERGGGGVPFFLILSFSPLSLRSRVCATSFYQWLQAFFFSFIEKLSNSVNINNVLVWMYFVYNNNVDLLILMVLLSSWADTSRQPEFKWHVSVSVRRIALQILFSYRFFLSLSFSLSLV